MPRLDLQYRNKDILHMVQALRAQTNLMAEHLSIVEARLQITDQDAAFQESYVHDRMTDLSLIAQNLSGEITTVWKRTR